MAIRTRATATTTTRPLVTRRQRRKNNRKHATGDDDAAAKRLPSTSPVACRLLSSKHKKGRLVSRPGALFCWWGVTDYAAAEAFIGAESGSFSMRMP